MPLLAAKDNKLSNIGENENGAWYGEAIVVCPQCKALQTVWINGGVLMTTRKFTQEGSHIYHDCGSSRPCRLYRIN